MARISQDELSHLNDLISQDPRKALELFLTYEQRYANDINFRRNSGAFLIDIGLALKDSNLIERGIKLIEQLLPTIEEQSRPIFLYNLGNGYAGLHSIARHRPGFSFDPDTTPLIKAKQYYREALAGLEHLDANLRAQLRINYGNCLSNLGRFLEAIYEYNAALSHMPDHPMAWGNLGVELERFAFIAGHSRILRDANEALNKALADNRLEQIGESWARPYFERVQQRIRQRLSKIKEDTSSVRSETPNFATAYHQAYVEFCVKHQLFLNFCLKNRPCAHRAEDTVRFSLTTALNNNTAFPRLARVVNEIKERYAAARLLIFEACNPPFDTQPYDDMTYYMDNLDYAVYGIRAAKLKLAFESAYNILDKIAFFINAYLNLGIKEDRVNFISMWKEKERKDTPLKSTIVQRNNYHLYGLYDISRDLASGGYLEHLRDIRRYLTHRYLVLHAEKLHWLTSADGPEYHSGYHELLDHAIELMRLVRSAVIYLIAFIDQEERGKHQQNAEGFIAPMPVHPCRHYP